MFSNNPFYAIVSGIIYILIIFLLVRKEKKYITYSITTLSGLLYLSFLFLWLEKTVYLMTSSDVGFSVYDSFLRFVNISYFVLFVPLLLIFAWYGIKKILSQDQLFWLKSSFVLVYVSALVGILILGQPVFVIFYYGFAP